MIYYAPYIDGTIAAFAGDELSVPFTPNKAVGGSNYMALLVKQLDSTIIDYVFTSKIENNTATFNLSDLDLTVGQFYKVQLAYSETGNEKIIDLTFSSIGVTKWIGGEPPYLETNFTVQDNHLIFNVAYFYGNDLSEKPYSYEIEVYDGNEELSIKEQALFNFKDNTLQYIIPKPPQALLMNRGIFNINCKITTINNYTVSVGDYISKSQEGLIKDGTNYQFNIDKEYGIIKCTPALDGYSLTKNNGTGWEYTNFIDATLAQGEEITYTVIGAIFYLNGKELIYSQSKSKPIIVDFEDMFLQDRNHILRIKFNPQISSFKDNIQESKQDTLGGKYPYFFRNGSVQYKEFPISGLISYLTQDTKMFIDDVDLGLEEISDLRDQTVSKKLGDLKVRTTNLEGYNIAAERKYKLAVMDWLNNGEPKLFRSPTEGNYIVRLMNVSLSPNDTLGRMLHTFSCTAYECAEATQENIKKYNLNWEGDIE